MNVIGTVFTKKGVVGDFDWMIRSGQYENALFLYNDDEMRQHWVKAGMGNAVIRKYNHYAVNRPRSAGILTGTSGSGYSELTAEIKDKIEACFHIIREILTRHRYDTVYYSAVEPNGLLGTSIFEVHPDVIQYITQKIRDLGTSPIVPPITEEAIKAIEERAIAVKSVKDSESAFCDMYTI